MQFGVREICNVVFKAKATQTIGNATFQEGQPVLYIDSAKTSELTGEATTVYATGGPGNTRLIAWEGEKTLTFEVEDALLSQTGFAILSGAGLLKGTEAETVYVHKMADAYTSDGKIDLSDALEEGETISANADIWVSIMEDGSITGETIKVKPDEDGTALIPDGSGTIAAGKSVSVDYYVEKKSSVVSELQIDGENFAGYYYVEASTLFRRQSDGVDLPAEITIPNAKIQSNFTFSMASTGDPSTFTFTMDAMPGYTKFDKTRKVMCVIQVIEETTKGAAGIHSVMQVGA